MIWAVAAAAVVVAPALAGGRAVCASDADEAARLQPEANHPEAEHWRCTLPRDDLPLPPPAAPAAASRSSSTRSF